MTKISGFLLKLMTNSFIVSLIAVVVAYLGNQNSLGFQLIGFIGFYSTIITIWLAILHLLSIILGNILKFIDSFLKKK
ncbi:MAG: hypothetical protein ABIP79_03450 [Chitinophagaceae bacterium]